MFITFLRFLYGAFMTRLVPFVILSSVPVRVRTKPGLAITLCRAQSPAPLTMRTGPHDVCQGTKNVRLWQSGVSLMPVWCPETFPGFTKRPQSPPGCGRVAPLPTHARKSLIISTFVMPY